MDRAIKTIIFIFLIIISLIMIVLFLQFLLRYFTPFILAIILANLINIPVNFLQKYFSFSRGFNVVLVLMCIIALTIFFTVFGVFRIYLEIEKLIENLPEDYDSLEEQINWLLLQNRYLYQRIATLNLPGVVMDFLNENLPLFYDDLRKIIFLMAGEFFKIIQKLPMVLTVLLLGFLASFFICRDKDKINDFLNSHLPEKWSRNIFLIKKEMLDSSLGFIRAQFILIAITGIITSCGLFIIGSSYYLTLGVFAAVLDLIPIIGPALIFYPWILYNLLSGSISFAIYLLILHTVLAIVRSLIESKIIGKNLGLHPLTIMIALYSGFRLMGLAGFVIGPAFLIIIKAIYKADLITIGE